MPGKYHIKPSVNQMFSSADKALETLTLLAGEHKTDVRVVWESNEGTLTISGRVTDDLGKPVSGARV